MDVVVINNAHSVEAIDMDEFREITMGSRNALDSSKGRADSVLDSGRGRY